MTEYRIYVLSPENRVVGPAQVVDVSDDQAAVEQAVQLVDGQAVEVW